MQALIISIGNELLNGRTVNSNATFISGQLQTIGIPARQAVTIKDTVPEIRATLQYALERADIVLITGGLGPTHDDITLQTLADFFRDKMIYSESIQKHIEEMYHKRGRELPAVPQKLAFVPENAKIIPNSVGTAPGIHFEKHGKHIFAMPGVPREMREMVKEYILPFLQAMYDQDTIPSKIYRTTGIPESQIYQRCKALFDTRPKYEIAYLPRHGGVDIRFAGKNLENDLEFEKALYGLVGKYIFATENISLAEAVGRILTEKQKTLAVAESCTGGLVQHKITDIPGSSAYFMGGFITYSNAAKMKYLDVSAESLENHGAVSKQVASEMATGLRKNIGVDYAIATTGIAGPGGATPTKPVGLMYAGLATAEKTVVKKFLLGNDRQINKERGALSALEMLRRMLLNIELD